MLLGTLWHMKTYGFESDPSSHKGYRQRLYNRGYDAWEVLVQHDGTVIPLKAAEESQKKEKLLATVYLVNTQTTQVQTYHILPSTTSIWLTDCMEVTDCKSNLVLTSTKSVPPDEISREAELKRMKLEKDQLEHSIQKMAAELGKDEDTSTSMLDLLKNYETLQEQLLKKDSLELKCKMRYTIPPNQTCMINEWRVTFIPEANFPDAASKVCSIKRQKM